ncbi:dihydrofolate reductase-like domain-containing protein [Syncephalis fuscata]|nr:dihydrofolate reductase-like domain-containing protein [Syncephalis fuscata]
MTLKTFHVVVACSLDNGIGVGHNLPWRLPRDMAHFHRVSTELPQGEYPSHYRNAAIMGRETYSGLPEKLRPLAGRLNVVLTSNDAFIKTLPDGVLTAKSLEDALQLLLQQSDVAEIFICGGTRLYAEAVAHPSCERAYITRVHTHVPHATAHFPSLFSQDPETITAAGWRRYDSLTGTDSTIEYDEYQKNGLSYEFQLYSRLV